MIKEGIQLRNGKNKGVKDEGYGSVIACDFQASCLVGKKIRKVIKGTDQRISDDFKIIIKDESIKETVKVNNYAKNKKEDDCLFSGERKEKIFKRYIFAIMHVFYINTGKRRVQQSVKEELLMEFIIGERLKPGGFPKGNCHEGHVVRFRGMGSMPVLGA